MWLFGRGNTAESEGGLADTTQAQKQRNKQIIWLREKVSGVTEIERDKRYRTSFDVHGQNITLDILLSERFPLEPPRVLATPSFIHPWFDQQMVVVGSPLIEHFTPHSDLGRAVAQVIEELKEHPPQFNTHSMASYMPQPHSSAVVPTFTPYSYSSTPQPILSSPPSSSHYVSFPASQETPPTQPITPPTLPASSSDFSHVLSKSDEELQKYLNDEDAVILIDKCISTLPAIKELQEKMEVSFQENEALSKRNIEHEPELQVKWASLQEQYLELHNVKERYDKLYNQQTRLLEKYDTRKIQASLKSLIQEADTESDIIAEDFLDNKQDVSTFVQNFLKHRKLYHLRGAKMEMLKLNRTS